MTAEDSQPLATDDTGRPEAPSGARARQEGGTPDGFLYDAFISYSRVNLDVAEKIELDLETFPLPPDIRKRLGRRHLNVFRDVNDLTGNRLNPAIEQNLEKSRTLVVLCSPAARGSRYVSTEIDRFAQLRDAEKIVPVLVAGGPNNDPRVDAAEWAFPDALLDVLGSDPLAADLRLAWSIKRRKAKLARGSPWIQLVAGIVSTTTDDLTDRIARAERRRLQSVVAVLLVVSVIIGFLGVVAWNQRNEAQDQRQEAVREARDALAAQLDTEASAVFSRVTAADSDINALADTLAAQRLRSDPTASRGAYYTATAALNITRFIIPTLAPVEAVAFSPDGHRIVLGTWESTVRVWDADNGRPIGAMTGHRDGVGTVAFSPDGHTLASGSRDHSVRLWNLTDPTHPSPLGPPLTGHKNIVRSVAFSRDGTKLASAGDDGTVRLWNLTDPTHPSPLGPPLTGHTNTVRSVAFSPDGHTLASASRDQTVRLWNLDSAIPLTGHTDAVRSVALSRDGHTLASGSQDGTVRLWNLTDPTHPSPLGPPLAGPTNAVASLAFSPDGHTLASGSQDGTVQLWNLTDPTHPSPLGPPLQAVYCVAFSPDGHTLASGSQDGTVQLWSHTDPAHLGRLGQPLHGHTDSVVSVAFSRDGHTLASGGADATVRLWSLADPAHPSRLGQPLTGHTNAVQSVAFSPDGHTLASGSADHTVQLWNLTDQAHPRHLGEPLTGHTDTVESVAFSPDGHTLASGTADQTVRLWPTPLDATVATLCSKLTSNISHQEWHDWISPTIGYITLCPNLPVPQN
jgi:WD40 repeat protein